MGLYQNNAGTLSLISGRGKAVYGASDVKTGTLNMASGTTASTAKWFEATVTFDSPMPDTNYLINIEVTHNAQYCIENIQFDGKTVNGFHMAAYHPTGTASTSIPVKYTAYKIYEDTQYGAIVNNQTYKTTEINTGKVWIDGKPIYKLSFTINNPNATWTPITLISSNVNTLIRGEACGLWSDGYQIMIGYKSSVDSSAFTYVVQNNKLSCYVENSRASGTLNKIWGTVEYTKVND